MEFALVVVLLMVLILSMVELITLIHTYNVLADAAKEGLRYAVVHGTGNSTPSGPTCPCKDIDGPAAPPGTVPGYGSGYGVVQTFAQYSLHNMAGMTVAVTYPDTANAPANKTILVTLANGMANSGYIYSDEAYSHLTFQVSGSHLKPGCAEAKIVSTAIDLMHRSGE